jgi:septum formation protein
MHTLSPAFIDAYLNAAGERVTKSVGCYQLEGLGIHLFEKIEGDHFTILGMPLLPLLAYFRAAGMIRA